MFILPQSLFHFFDLTRPANILYHLNKIAQPTVLTPILIDYSEYDRHHRKGLAGILFIAYFLQPVKKAKSLDVTVKYEAVENWLQLPAHLKLGNPVGLDTDSNQNLVVFCRADREWPLLGPMPESPIENKTVLIISKDSGKLMESWGENRFIMPNR